MSADDLVHESGLARPRASDIETASLNSGGHETKADCDLRTQSEIYPVNIEAVAQLARFYANGTPPDEEFRLIKEWINTPCNVDKQKGAHLPPKEWRAAQETRPRGVTYEPHTADDAFNQRTEIIREKSDFSAELRAVESAIRVVPRPSGFKDRFVSARALMRGRISRRRFLFLCSGDRSDILLALSRCKRDSQPLGLVGGPVVIGVYEEVAACTRHFF